MGPKHVAVYWDFENVHASLYEEKNGEASYRKGRYAKQEELVEIEAVMRFILPLGPLAVNRAYANWTWLSSYQNAFNRHSFDLIQLFARGTHAKNGADIRMALDVIEDAALFPHIGRVVIVGGDSDYIAVGQKLRQKGIEVIGVGPRKSTNRFWIDSCNDFKYYDVLTSGDKTQAGDVGAAKQLMLEALDRVASMRGEPFARMSSLKFAMKQLDPAFDEAEFGFRNFTDFIGGCTDVVRLEQGPHERHVHRVAEVVIPSPPPAD
jgi:uncharacterized LabA/DUF88 family protein